MPNIAFGEERKSVVNESPQSSMRARTRASKRSYRKPIPFREYNGELPSVAKLQAKTQGLSLLPNLKSNSINKDVSIKTPN